MGSVGSLIEKPDVSPSKSNRAAPQVPGRQNHGLLKKGFNQRELLNYFNITKKETKSSKHIISGTSSIKREHRREDEHVYTKVYHRDGKEVDLGKNSLPIGGKFDKVCLLHCNKMLFLLKDFVLFLVQRSLVQRLALILKHCVWIKL